MNTTITLAGEPVEIHIEREEEVTDPIRTVMLKENGIFNKLMKEARREKLETGNDAVHKYNSGLITMIRYEEDNKRFYVIMSYPGFPTIAKTLDATLIP